MNELDVFRAFIASVEERIAQMDEEDASGLVIVCTNPEANNYRQIIGPFPKNTAEALECLEAMTETEKSEGVTGCTFEIDYLFPPEFAYVGGQRPERMGEHSVLNEMMHPASGDEEWPEVPS